MKEVIFKLPDEVLTLIINKVENTPQEASLLEKWIYDGEERKTGKWIREFRSEADFIRGQYSYRCPFCGEYGGGNYCSECGAKMEVDE